MESVVTTEPADRGPSFDPSAQPVAPTAEFLAASDRAGLVFEPGDLERLGRYLAFLRDANARFNLTAIDEPAEMWIRHVADSLSLMPAIATMLETPGASARRRLIDVGSGGGVPGIPLAIACPDIDVVLLEATGKKARFLREVVAALRLENVEILEARAEDAGRDRERHREGYDLVTSRAVGPLKVLLELTLPFARVGGLVLAIKGERAEAEIVEAKAALHLLHARSLETTRTPTGTTVAIEKVRATPKLYPRRAGEPKRAPLGG